MDMDHELKQATANMQVHRYKLELQEKMMINAAINEKVEEVGAETAALFQEYTHEEIERMKIKDFVKIIHSLQNMIMMLRRRMTQHERDRL